MGLAVGLGVAVAVGMAVGCGWPGSWAVADPTSIEFQVNFNWNPTAHMLYIASENCPSWGHNLSVGCQLEYCKGSGECHRAVKAILD